MEHLKLVGVETGKGKYCEEVIYSLGRISRIIIDRITVYLSKDGLTPGKLNILMTVNHRGGEWGVSQAGNSKHLIVTKSNLTKLIIKLERDGIVRRFAMAGDKRVP